VVFVVSVVCGGGGHCCSVVVVVLVVLLLLLLFLRDAVGYSGSPVVGNMSIGKWIVRAHVLWSRLNSRGLLSAR